MLHARARLLLRTLRVALGCALFVAHASVPAQAQDLLHYDPPPVDAIYPAGDDHDAPGDAGAPAIEVRGIDAGLADAGVAEALDAALPRVALPEPEYGAQARVAAAPEPEGAHVVTLQHARDLPGAFGDPLRILDALPGVVPIASGVPYVYLRGAPPASIGYAYDDIPLPQLFHAAFGPAVLHARATGPVELHGGIPPARFGRRAGGLLRAQGTPYGSDFAGEVELRLIDSSVWVQGPLGRGVATASTRIGYPKLAILAAEGLGVVEPGTKLNYWDGQVRTRQPLSSRDDFELVWLGSYDAIVLPGVSNVPGAGASKLHFQRIETRYLHRLPRGEFGTALRFGFDQSELGSALAVRAFTLGPRFWTDLRFGRQHVRFGGDVYVSQGDVINGDGLLGSPDGDLRVSLPRIASAPARAQGGGYVETNLQASPRVRFDLGLRLDYWSRQADLDFAVDPRLRATFDVASGLTVHAAFGMAHQPAVFFFPLPGLTEVAVDSGLSRSLQSEVGASYDLPLGLRLEAQAYLHTYTHLLLPELVSDGSIQDDPPLSDAIAYGLELFLKREIGRYLTGWISYTLGWAEADSKRSIGKFRPDFDVRHVINVVANWNIWRGLTLGGRLHARSGRLIEQLNPRYEQRLPWFVRGDVRFGYGWQGRWARMTAYAEWLNVAVQGEYLDADCLFGRCIATRAPPISIPNLGVRAEF